jgi:hypothetical protein
MTPAPHVVSPVPSAEQPPPPQPVPMLTLRRRLVFIVLAVIMFLAAVFVLGMPGLLPFGLLLAFSIDSDEEARRSVSLTPRNLALAVVMVAALAWLWLSYVELAESTRVLIAGALIALPVALHEPASDGAREHAVAVTKRNLILTLWGLVIFIVLYQDMGVWFFGLAAVCVVLPLVLASSRAWAARRGRIEVGLLRHPLRRDMRPHLGQSVNIWLCCGLLGGILAAGGTHFARIWFSLNAAQFNLMIVVFGGGLVLLAASAVVPRRRVYLSTNLAVALLSGFLAVQLVPMADAPTDPVVLDSPLTGEWFVFNGGRSFLVNGHLPNEINAIDFARLGTNGRTHTGGAAAPLSDYAGFGSPLLAPADGRIVEVTDDYPDNPPGTNGDYANHLVMDIGAGRYVSLAHLKQGSVRVRVGDVVRRGQPLAAVGNNGHSNEPHLHLQVQDSPAGMDADRTYPMVFRNVHITRGGVWPWGDKRELRTGDLVRALGR